MRGTIPEKNIAAILATSPKNCNAKLRIVHHILVKFLYICVSSFMVASEIEVPLTTQRGE